VIWLWRVSSETDSSPKARSGKDGVPTQGKFFAYYFTLHMCVQLVQTHVFFVVKSYMRRVNNSRCILQVYLSLMLYKWFYNVINLYLFCREQTYKMLQCFSMRLLQVVFFSDFLKWCEHMVFIVVNVRTFDKILGAFCCKWVHEKIWTLITYYSHTWCFVVTICDLL
jgi:hypothetical protein